MTNLFTRLLTGFVAIPLILLLLYRLPWWAFGLLAFSALLIASYEFFLLTHPSDRIGRFFGVLLCAVTFGVLVVTNFGANNANYPLILFSALAPSALLFTLFRIEDMNTALARMGALVLGPMYLGVMLGAIGTLRRVGPIDRVGASLVVLSLMVSWASDTFGYFFGKGIGGPKMYPTVSPNKTWAGAIGGLVGSALSGVVAHFVFLPEMSLGSGVALCAVAGALGQAGDFCESVMKRSVGVKDSGGILPGHGGMLDRLDATNFVSLALLAFVRMGWLLQSP